MSEQDNCRIVEQFWAAVNAKDLDPACRAQGVERM
jgi:limonene-1,2-epoxide hydrolase